MTSGWLANCVQESCRRVSEHFALPAIDFFFPGGREARAACAIANKAASDPPKHSARFHIHIRIVTLVIRVALHALLSTAQ